MAQSFLDFVDRRRFSLDEIDAVRVSSTPEYGDLGATPRGKSAQIIKDIVRSHLPP